MNASPEPKPVQRFVRRPLPWLALALLWGTIFFISDVSWARAEAQRLDQRLHVVGTTAEGWDGSTPVLVTYRHPRSGASITASVSASQPRLVPDPGPVALRVDLQNATDVRFAADRPTITFNLAVYCAWIAIPLGLYLARRHHVRRVGNLIAGAGPTYVMSARVSRPHHLGWRWRLHLYPLDARPDAEPVCTLVLIGSRPQAAGMGPEFPVEVKGLPRPFGRLAVRTRPAGDVLWSTGRALCR